MTTSVNLISLSSQSSHNLDNNAISSAYHGNSGRATIEAEAINGIEQGLDRLQKSINKEKEIFGLSQRLLGKMFVFSFIVFISHLLVTYISEIPEPRPANSGFKYIPSLRLITCCCQIEMDHPYLGNGNV